MEYVPFPAIESFLFSNRLNEWHPSQKKCNRDCLQFRGPEIVFESRTPHLVLSGTHPVGTDSCGVGGDWKWSELHQICTLRIRSLNSRFPVCESALKDAVRIWVYSVVVAMWQSNLRDLLVALGIYGTLPGSPILVVVLSKAQVCGISIIGIAASNPVGGMELGLLYSVCLVYVAASETRWSLVQGSPTVYVCVCVIMCDPETWTLGQRRPNLGCCTKENIVWPVSVFVGLHWTL
jgi:hypothetical protein